MTRVVVEYLFEAPPTAEAVGALELCLTIREVTSIVIYRSPDGLHQVRVFEAPDTEAVRQAHRSSSFPFIACWVAA